MKGSHMVKSKKSTKSLHPSVVQVCHKIGYPVRFLYFCIPSNIYICIQYVHFKYGFKMQTDEIHFMKVKIQREKKREKIHKCQVVLRRCGTRQWRPAAAAAAAIVFWSTAATGCSALASCSPQCHSSRFNSCLVILQKKLFLTLLIIIGGFFGHVLALLLTCVIFMIVRKLEVVTNRDIIF